MSAIQGPEVLIAIVALVVVGKVGMTIARGSARRLDPSDGASLTEVHALREEVEHLRDELEAMQGRTADMDEIQNRLDFAERTLMQLKERGALPAPKET